MKHGDKQHKDAWVKHVATKLGFETLPQDLLQKAEMLYDRGWTAPGVIENIRRYITMVHNV